MFQNFDDTADPAAGPARLSALRAALAARGLHGFVIPRGDAHQGENVAPRDARLGWLTGFTGSAGFAVALVDRAAIFVDGRYDLQVRQQVDGAAWERLRIETIKPEAWLKDALAPGRRLAYDPWLHGRDQVEALRKAAEGAGAELVASENLIDAVWPDQPAPPLAPVAIHPEALAGRSAADKRAALGAALDKAGRAAAVLTLPDSLAWLLNIRGGDIARTPVAHAFGLLRADGSVALFIAPEKLSDPVRGWLGNAVATADPAAFGPALDALAGKRVQVDRASAPDWVARRLEAAGAEVVWDEDPCIAPKARKTEAELSGARAAHRRDGAALARFLHWFEAEAPKGGLTEIAVVEALEGFRGATGDLRDISFDTICGAGPNGAVVHYRVNRATDRAIAPGDLVLIDSGGQYPDGTTDVTRTLATGPGPGRDGGSGSGGGAPEGAARGFTLVLAGMIAISRARWPEGLAGRDLDALARAALWRAGMDYDHGTGHGVGAYLGVHEGPQGLSRRSLAPLAPGMILSNEPGLYREGEWGIRIENLLAVTPPAVPEGGDRAMLGFETLTLAPIDRRLIVAELLAPEDRAWLDAYHARVLAEIGPLLAGDPAAEWLARVCAPL